MAKLHRIVRAEDKLDSHVFTFLLPPTLGTENSRDIVSTEFPCGYQRWGISITQKDNYLGTFLTLKNIVAGLTCTVDYGFTLVSKGHYTNNDSFNEKNVVFTKERSTHGRKAFMSMTDLRNEKKSYMHLKGEFVIEVHMGNFRTIFDFPLQIPMTDKDRARFPNNDVKLETGAFHFGGADWNVVLKLVEKSASDARVGSSVYLRRLSSLDHYCTFEYRIYVGHKEVFPPIGMANIQNNLPPQMNPFLQQQVFRMQQQAQMGIPTNQTNNSNPFSKILGGTKMGGNTQGLGNIGIPGFNNLPGTGMLGAENVGGGGLLGSAGNVLGSAGGMFGNATGNLGSATSGIFGSATNAMQSASGGLLGNKVPTTTGATTTGTSTTTAGGMAGGLFSSAGSVFSSAVGKVGLGTPVSGASTSTGVFSSATGAIGSVGGGLFGSAGNVLNTGITSLGATTGAMPPGGFNAAGPMAGMTRNASAPTMGQFGNQGVVAQNKMVRSGLMNSLFVDYDTQDKLVLPVNIFKVSTVKGFVTIRIECVQAKPITLLQLPMDKNRHRALRCYDRDKQGWLFEPHMKSDKLKFYVFNADISSVPRNHIRLVSFGVSVIPAYGETKSVRAQGSPYSKYYIQQPQDDFGLEIPTGIPMKDIMDAQSVYIYENTNSLTVQIEWGDSYLLSRSDYQLSDDTARLHKMQMEKEILILQKENLILEKQLHLYQMNIAQKDTKGPEDGTERPRMPNSMGLQQHPDFLHSGMIGNQNGMTHPDFRNNVGNPSGLPINPMGPNPMGGINSPGPVPAPRRRNSTTGVEYSDYLEERPLKQHTQQRSHSATREPFPNPARDLAKYGDGYRSDSGYKSDSHTLRLDSSRFTDQYKSQKDPYGQRTPRQRPNDGWNETDYSQRRDGMMDTQHAENQLVGRPRMAERYDDGQDYGHANEGHIQQRQGNGRYDYMDPHGTPRSGNGRYDQFEGQGTPRSGSHFEGQGTPRSGSHFEGQGTPRSGSHFEAQGTPRPGSHVSNRYDQMAPRGRHANNMPMNSRQDKRSGPMRDMDGRHDGRVTPKGERYDSHGMQGKGDRMGGHEKSGDKMYGPPGRQKYRRENHDRVLAN